MTAGPHNPGVNRLPHLSAIIDQALSLQLAAEFGPSQPGKGRYRGPMIDLIVIAILILAAVISATVVVLPPVSFAYVVTACGILLTWRIQNTQAKLAERKLFLDLMPRRSEWYDRLRIALEKRELERRAMIEALVIGEVPPPPNQQSILYQLETEAGWLFSGDMVGLMALLIKADHDLYENQLKARGGNHEAALNVGNRYLEVVAKQSKVQDYLVRYLYVGDIGKPKRSPHKPPNYDRRYLLNMLRPDQPKQQ